MLYTNEEVVVKVLNFGSSMSTSGIFPSSCSFTPIENDIHVLQFMYVS